jgi:VWFA-related protein
MMKRRLSLALALALLASNAFARTPAATQQQTPPAAQQPSTQTTPAPTPTQTAPASTSTQATATPQTTATPQVTPQATPVQESEEDVVRITSNLVQFDAVVTDKQGHPVTDLRPEDFEVYANGRKQQITNFSFVNAEAGGPVTVAAPAPKRAADRTAPPLPPARIKPGQVRRTVALVVDDLGTSFESIAYVRRALKKFVDEQMQPGDLVAIMRTSAGMGALQQFTSDKNILYRAIERVRWYPGRSGVSAFAPMEGQMDTSTAGGSGAGMGSAAGSSADASADLEDFRDQIFSVGTLGALNFIVRGMEELPGRKSVIMFSDGFSIYDQQDPTKRQRVLDNLRRLVDLANRASVVVYTVDARGLPTLGLTAADDTSGRTMQQVQQEIAQRSINYHNSQDGPRSLADQTGGFFIHDNNDLGGAIRRVMEDQKGYYLIGFRPDESVFERIRGRVHYNSLQVKLKRPGLKVRARSGFIGLTDAEAKPQRRTRVEQMVGALASPFASGDVPLRLTSLFGGGTTSGSFVTSLMHIDLGNVTFTDEPDGWHKAVLDLVAITFGEEGQVVDSIDRTETLRVRNQAFDVVRRDGLVYTMQVPIKKPGAYQLRVAVRDAANEKLGSASQFIEVPDLKKDRLALSGILMQSSAYTSAQLAAAAPPAPGQQKDDETRAKENERLAQGSPAVRRFHLGEEIDYYVNIYNAQLDASGRPQLQTQLRIFRDNQQVYAGNPAPFDPGKQTNMKNLLEAVRMRLNNLAPGEYVFQIVVTDALAKEKYRTATQWIDFEIVK